jgi:hypothetical protein
MQEGAVAGWRVAAELHKIDPRLTFELGVSIEPHELIISAGGLRDAFPTVKRLVSAAPPIAGWRFIAFSSSMPPVSATPTTHP